MIRWNKICKMIGLALILFTFDGCSVKKATVDDVMEEIKATEESESKDLDLDMDDVILQVGNSSVTYREVLFYVYQAKKCYEGKLDNAVWDVSLEDGSSFEEYAKKEVLRELTEIKIMNEEAKEENITLSGEEIAQAENKAATFLQGVTAEEKENYGFEEELVKLIYEDHAIADKMFENVTKDVSAGLNEEDYRQVQVQYIQVMTNGTDKSGTDIKMTDEQKKKAAKRTETLLSKAKKEEDFEAYARTKSDAAEVTLTFGKEDMPAVIGEPAMNLKTGEFSEVLEGEDGYYIVYCANDNVKKSTEEKIAVAKKELEDKSFETAYTGWSEKYGVEVSVNLWKSISVKEI